jgi:hypothetical protein
VTVHYTITPTGDWGKTIARGADYGGTTGGSVGGTLTFTRTATAKTITIVVYGDTTTETDEPVIVTLTSATGAVITRSTGTLTILNDD